MEGLQAQITELKAQLALMQTGAAAPKVQVILPERFDGTRKKLPVFLAQVELYFSQLPVSAFPTDASKVAFMLSLCTGDAAQWAVTLITGNSALRDNLANFKIALQEAFGDPLRVESAGWELYRLRQGRGSLLEYLNKFKLLAHQLEWGEKAFMLIFTAGLNETLQDELARLEPATNWDNLITKVLRINARLEFKARSRGPTRPVFESLEWSKKGVSEEEPMQLGTTKKLSVAERERRRKEQLCLYCAAAGHFARDCPVKPSRVSGKGQP